MGRDQAPGVEGRRRWPLWRLMLSREHVAPQRPPAPAFDAARLIASHRSYFADEAAMAEASIARIVSAGGTHALPPVWLAHAELDDNVPAEITEAFVSAYEKAGGRIERVFFPWSVPEEQPRP